MNTILIPRILLMTLLLSVLGYLGNYLALPIAYGVSFIFGSIFSILAIVLLGLKWGLLVSIIVASYTFFLWNHPYAVIIFALEALWIGTALRRGNNNLVFIDALFWLSAGPILVVAFYWGIMGLNAQSVLMIILKQSINGMFNALIASLILYIPSIRRLRRNTSITYSFKNMIFNVIAVFLMLPTLSLLLIENYQENINLNKQVASSVQVETHQLKDEISSWVNNHLRAVEAIAQLPSEIKLEPSPQLQNKLARIKNLFPDFKSVYLANESATTVGFYPAKNSMGESLIGINFSDRTYFKNLVAHGKPIVSDVFTGRGGTNKPIVTISVPVMNNNALSHYALGAINLEKIQDDISLRMSEKLLQITVLDSNGDIIISSDINKNTLQKFNQFTGTRIKTELDDVYFHVPGKSKNISVMKVWKGASYFSSSDISKTNWTLLVEYPLAPMQKKLQSSAIKGLSALAILLLPMLFIAFALSNALTGPLRILARISQDLPSQIESKETIDWPKSNVTEIEQLIENFKQASQALGDKIGTLNNRLSLATDSAGIGVWDYYVKENILIWDKWMYTLYGIKEENFNGAYDAWKSGLHPEDLFRCDEAINLALSDDQDFDIEFRVLWPSGEIRYIKANAQVQRDENGDAVRMIGINYDITDRKEAIDKLEKSVKKAQVANEAKSEFLANMSHEIRTPMNGVVGMINLLLRTDLTKKQYSFASTVKSSAESLLSIINDILDFSKVEAGKLKLDLVDFDLNQLMKEFSAVMTFRAEEKDLLLTCENTSESNFLLHGDSGRIRQILTNLVGNAIKFTEQGEIKIVYHQQENKNNQVLLKFEISDNGIGLSEQQQRLLFDRFSQADGSTTRRYGGTGLGLAISKQLVELMGGEIHVDSIHGEGSKFWFTLNLDRGQGLIEHHGFDSIGMESNVIEADSNTVLKFMGRVLVVEDNPINQMVAQSQLEDFGLQVDLAENGKIALEKLSSTAYDLVFMDCQMPVMDGFEASVLIRSDNSKVLNSDIPIVAMTANALKGDREKCLDAGMNDYITKPVDPNKVVQALTKWLAKS